MSISQFKTQASLKKYVREMMDSIGLCDSVKEKHPEEFLDFCELFKRHSDYPKKFIGLVDIKINKNPIFNDLTVYIVKINGEIDDVSVMKNCITGKPKDNLNTAMRVSVQPQIDEYKNNNFIKVCELCGEIDEIEIDHHSEKAPFAKLYSDFMKLNTLPNDFTFIAKLESRGSRGFREYPRGCRPSTTTRKPGLRLVFIKTMGLEMLKNPG